MAALSAAGYRAVAPDLRGYGRSPKPQGIEQYGMSLLVEDVAELARSLGGRISLVGHDWGGVVAWYTAMLHPELVETLVIMNAPHPRAYAREIRSGSSQILRSWYAGFFQLPWLPELLLRAGRKKLLRRVWASGPARDPEVRAQYEAAFAQPGAITCALNYYRAAARKQRPRTNLIEQPVLLLWGDRDRYLVRKLTRGLDEWVPSIRVRHLKKAGHWLHHDEPDTVNEALVNFLRDHRRSE